MFAVKSAKRSRTLSHDPFKVSQAHSRHGCISRTCTRGHNWRIETRCVSRAIASRATSRFTQVSLSSFLFAHGTFHTIILLCLEHEVVVAMYRCACACVCMCRRGEVGGRGRIAEGGLGVYYRRYGGSDPAVAIICL